MATIKNSFDKILQATVPRFAPPTDRGFFVNPERAIFTVTNGIASPSSFNFTPTLLSMAGTVSYVPSAGLGIAVSGNNFSLAYSDMTVAAGTVTCTLVVDGVTYTRVIPVSRVVDGIAPKLLDLVPSSQVFKVAKDGSGSPGSIELIAKGQNLTGTPNFTILAGTAVLAIGADSTRKQLTFANTSTDLVQVQVTQDGQIDTVTIVKVREGADGANAVSPFLTNESQTVPANLDGSTISMAGATTTMKVYVGATDDSANWTYTGSPASSAGAITYTLGATNGVLTASGLNAGIDSAYVDITAARAGLPSVTKRFSLSKSKTGPAGASVTGPAGARGNVNLSVITSGSAWSDAEANAAIVNMTGTSARAKDVINLYRVDRTWAQKRIYDGFNWSILADVFDGAIFVKGSVISDALATGAVTARTLGVGAVTASSILVGTSDNIVPDPAFHDLAWWGRSTTGVAGLWADNGQQTPWLAGASLYLNPSAGESVSYSRPFPITPGATYLVQCQVELSADFNGRASVFWTIPGVVDYSVVDRSTGLSWTDGLPVQLRDSSPKGIITFTTTYKVSESGSLSRGVIQLRNSHTAGTISVGSISITRMSDDALVVTGGIKARHLELANGGSVNIGATGFGQGNGISIEGIVPGSHGARMYVGRQDGPRILMDPDNSQLELVGVKIAASMTASISPGSNIIYRNSNEQFNDVYAGNFAASAGNASANLSYAWSVSTESGYVSASVSSVSGASSAVLVTGKIFSGQEIDVFVSCRITDLNNGVSRVGGAIITVIAQ